MGLAIAVSTSYRIGEYTALVLVGLVFIWLVLRAIGLRPRHPEVVVPVAPVVHSSPPTTSVAPPGFAPSAASVAVVASVTGSKPRFRRNEAIAALERS